MMRHITTPGFLMLLAVAVLAAGVGGPFLLTENPKAWMIVLAAAGAVAGFLFNSAIKFHSEMRDRAFDRMESATRDEQFLKEIGTVFGFIRKYDAESLTNKQLEYIVAARISALDKEESQDAGEGEEEAEGKTPYNDPILAAKTKKAFYLVANFFDEMAIGIYAREMNEVMLRDFYIGIFMRFYDQFQHFIPVIHNIGKKYRFEEHDNYPIVEKVSYLRLPWLHKRWDSVYKKMLKKERKKAERIIKQV